MSLLRSKYDNTGSLRYWADSYYDKYRSPDAPKYRRDFYDYYTPITRPYTYTYDVPSVHTYPRSYDPRTHRALTEYGASNVRTYPRSLYGRTYGTQSEYGYHLPYTYRSEPYSYRYMAPEEQDLYYPRYSRYNRTTHWY